MTIEYRTDLEHIPNRDWDKQLISEEAYRGEVLRIFTVEPQAHLIGVTQPVGLLGGWPADALMVKAFQKNYHTEAAKPKVVEHYGFEKKHGEPIEIVNFVYETFYDRACEGEMNRYRHNSKNMESGRYVNYVKHGLCVVVPEDVKAMELKYGTNKQFVEYYGRWVVKVQRDLREYLDVLKDCDALEPQKRYQQARRRIGEYRAVEGVYSPNLRSLLHMGTQRSAEYSPNGKEAEPQISSVVTQMLKAMKPYLPVFAETVLEQVAKGYR